jgi:hypothetical protein
MKKALFVIMVTVFSAGVLHAQQPVVVTDKEAGWHKIGDAKVDFKTDKDRFIIIGADRFKSVKVKAFDAAVKIEEMQIFYEGGAKESVPVAAELNPGDESKVIALKNHSAELKKVVFVYKTVSNASAEKARIELWGMK